MCRTLHDVDVAGGCWKGKGPYDGRVCHGEVGAQPPYCAWANWNLQTAFSLGIDGNISATTEGAVDVPAAVIPVDAKLGAGVKVSSSTVANIAANFRFVAKTSEIAVTGLNQQRTKWALHRTANQSLRGSHLLAQIILVPSGTNELLVRSRVQVSVPNWLGISYPLKASEWRERKAILEEGMTEAMQLFMPKHVAVASELVRKPR